MKLLLDTNTYCALMRGHEAVSEYVRGAEKVLVSAVVAGELLAGFHGGAHLSKNLGEFDRFLKSPFVEFVPVSLVTADRFGRIAAVLRRKGTPIPSNDIWLAAHALEYGAELLSFDSHFRHVDGVAWLSLSGS
jgi:tRNA(fMet)-specific endonuclease VapC